MEIAKYLCEFFFNDFWHWLGLTVTLTAIRFGTVIIDKSHQVVSNSKNNEKKE